MSAPQDVHPAGCPPIPAVAADPAARPTKERAMLAFTVFGTKEIIVYVVVVIVLILIAWYLMRGRSRA
jgi:hypothetical protein